MKNLIENSEKSNQPVYTDRFIELLKYSNVGYLLVYILLLADENQQLATSVRELSTATGLSVRTIRTSLEKLIASDEISFEPTHCGSVISVLRLQFYIKKTEPTDTATTEESPYFFHCDCVGCMKKRYSYNLNALTDE